MDRAAQAYVDGLAEVAAMDPEDAARAAGARTPEEIQVLAARIREQFHSAQPQTVQPPLPTPIDPDSDRGRRITEQLARNHAAVLARLAREGKPIPAAPAMNRDAPEP